MGRLILVSNRLPISVKRVGNQKTIVKSSGGLVAGLGPIHEAGDGLWIGNFDGVKGLDAQLQAQRLVPVSIPKEDAERHYEGYSNQVLWPLCHYLLEHVEFDGPDYAAYARVNERFADAVAAQARPGDMIWVHDYHLMLLPQLLRQRLPGACIGFFLHIPFPSSEVFRILPRKEEILRGLLGANLIGLHTYDYARHLVSTLRRVLAVEFDDDCVIQSDGQCRIGVFPLGVDVAMHQELARAPAVERKVERLRKQMHGRKVILGVDRMDYTKGLPQRFAAFSELLRQQRHWREGAVLVQLAVPSRANIASYQHLKEDIDRRVGEINGTYQTAGTAPVHYLYRSVPADELAALYRLADVALVTPTRDGMNLVAKEYIASRSDDSGVLVLSEFAGAAAEMGEALLVNPYDIEGTAAALDRALNMSPEETRLRMAALRKRVAANTVHHWVARFIKALKQMAAHPQHVVSAREKAKTGWMDAVCAQFATAPRALLALDYDGTLTELTATPGAAAPSPQLLELLQRLGELPGVDLVIISGRPPDTMRQWLGKLPAHLIAEHGFHRRLRGMRGWQDMLPMYDLSWKEPVHALLEEYTQRAPGARIEEKPLSLVWHYRQVEPGFGQWLARELGQHLSEAFSNSPVVVMHGSRIVEIRPQGLDKGKALSQFIHERGPYEFIAAAGDDRTDEDMFVALPKEAWTIKVGVSGNHSHARFYLSDPALVRRFLQRLSESRDAAAAGAGNTTEQLDIPGPIS